MLLKKRKLKILRMLKLKVKRLHPEAILPTKAYKKDAGIDLYAIEDVVIPAGEKREVRTGIAVEIPEGYHIQLHTRSSYGKKDLRCHLGIIDQGYRNEISVWVFNHQLRADHSCLPLGILSTISSVEIKKGDKVCQMILLPVPEVEIEEVEKLSDSERGMRGHGSSGR